MEAIRSVSISRFLLIIHALAAMHSVKKIFPQSAKMTHLFRIQNLLQQAEFM